MGIVQAQSGAGTAVDGIGRQRERAQVRQVGGTIAGGYDGRIPGNGVIDEIFTASETDFLLGALSGR